MCTSTIQGDKIIKRRHWLVDMENVPSRWESILPKCHKGDNIILFISDSVGSVRLKTIADACTRGITFGFISCDTGLPNAMDFQLVTELGRLSIIEPDSEFYIVSCDRGFNSIVKFMRERGVSVICYIPDKNITPPVKLISENQSDPVWHTYNLQLKSVSLPLSDLLQVTDILYEAMTGKQNRRKIGCLNRLRSKYGNKQGQEYYRLIKDIVHSIASTGPFPKDPNIQPNPEYSPESSPIGGDFFPCFFPEVTEEISDLVSIEETIPIPQSAPMLEVVSAPKSNKETTATFNNKVNVTLLKSHISLKAGDAAKVTKVILSARGAKDPQKALNKGIGDLYKNEKEKKAVLKAVLPLL